jgi:hypothetical protein
MKTTKQIIEYLEEQIEIAKNDIRYNVLSFIKKKKTRRI